MHVLKEKGGRLGLWLYIFSLSCSFKDEADWEPMTATHMTLGNAPSQDLVTTFTNARILL